MRCKLLDGPGSEVREVLRMTEGSLSREAKGRPAGAPYPVASSAIRFRLSVGWRGAPLSLWFTLAVGADRGGETLAAAMARLRAEAGGAMRLAVISSIAALSAFSAGPTRSCSPALLATIVGLLRARTVFSVSVAVPPVAFALLVAALLRTLVGPSVDVCVVIESFNGKVRGQVVPLGAALCTDVARAGLRAGAPSSSVIAALATVAKGLAAPLLASGLIQLLGHAGAWGRASGG